MLTIAARFCGPPGSGNGGYTAGLLAAELAAAAEPITVALRLPPPLDTELHTETTPAGARLLDGDRLVAEATAGAYRAAPVAPVGPAEAEQAAAYYPGLLDHPFPGCFVCGPDRGVGDGMRLTPGRTAAGRTACLWTPDHSTAAAETADEVAGEFVWCALDCPGGWASDLGSRPLVLGTMTGSQQRALRVAQPYVVVGQLLGTEGRKTTTATAVYTADGDLVARAEQVWIAVDPALFNPGQPHATG